jgi:hypothetical protein
MTSYGGLVVFQQLFQRLRLFERLDQCCAHLDGERFYRYGMILRCLVVHLLLGCRQLRESDFYRDDPLVQRVVGLKQLPSVPTVSRMLREFDARSVAAQHELNRALIIQRLEVEQPATITLDFDGSVQSTKRHAEGTAVGFNKVHKGARSYYPLFCTVAQTGQVFDELHRSGNVHDSNGAVEFVTACVGRMREQFPGARIEARLDSAFFSEELLRQLETLNVEYTVSVPFERFSELKQMIQERSWWWRVPGSEGKRGFFETRWKPQCWPARRRFLFIRQEVPEQRKEPLQLDLFEPVEYNYEYKAIVSNKRGRAGKVARFHEGRGYQEKILGELKSQTQMDYIPCRKRVANQVYLLCTMLAHNLGRELQMQAVKPVRGTTEQRTARWIFAELDTLRRTILQRAGRLTRPQGKLTLTLPDIPSLQEAIRRFLPANL